MAIFCRIAIPILWSIFGLDKFILLSESGLLVASVGFDADPGAS
jgi:hypothetical protein